VTFSIQKNPNASKAAALKAAREQASSAPTAEQGAIQRWISAGEAKDRIRIVFDDSGSMASQIENAKEGVTEFLRNCIPNQTAVAIHMLCAKEQPIENLNSNLIEVATLLKETRAGLGGTPLFNCALKALTLSPKLTRMVVFTDGEPTDNLLKERENVEEVIADGFTLVPYKNDADVLIRRAKDLGCPIDTVFFGANDDRSAANIKFLKYLAESTGGYFLHFDPKKPNIWKQLKYLAPVNRLMLTSESVRKEIEDGRR
jgi:Mg-chelatase subunit ChlD